MGYIKTTLVTPDPRIFIREHNKALRAANEAAADYHHRINMPDHFKMVGYSKYQIDKRSAKYNKRKHRRVNHVLPNVYTGNTRREVLGQRQIRATPKGARLLMRFSLKGGSGRFYVRRGMKLQAVSSQIEMMRRVAELEAISEGEQKSIMQEVKRAYVSLVNQNIAAGGRVRKRKG
jgi:hypothetical protein